MTSLALVSSPSEAALTQLQVLRQDLAGADLALPDVLALRDRAAAIRAWAATARLGLSVANEAAEVMLTAERAAGLLLLDLVASSGPSTRRDPQHAGPPARVHVPPGTLRQVGLTPKLSSQYQLLAKLPAAEFGQRVSAIKDAGKLLGHAPLLRAAHRFVSHRGRKTTPAASLLRRALILLKDVTVIRSRDELELARQVVKIGESWALVINPPSISERPDAIKRVTSCLLCGRGRPPSRPPTCPSCGGAWLEA